MSKICIIGASNIKHMSLISLYTTFFEANGIAYDIIYMDRYGIEEKTGAQNQFCYHASPIKSKKDKIREFIRFRFFAKNKIKKNNYDLIITWQTTSAYLFADILLGKYKSRFIVNVRDYVAENNKVIRFVLKMLLKKASLVAISSEGFREFLPDGEYTLVNSINDEILKDCKPLKRVDREQTFRIGFAGNCRYFRESYKMIQSLANDKRFEIWYCGTNSDHLREYAQKHNVLNVKTMPAFSPAETLDIFAKFDIVNSAFGNDAWDNRTLMPIRLYTALGMHLPMLVSAGTQLAKEVERGNIGFVIDDYSSLGDRLYEYLKNTDMNELAQNCDKYIGEARKQNEIFYDRLHDLIKGMK